MSWKPTQRSGRGREAHLKVREGSGGPPEGPGGPPGGPGGLGGLLVSHGGVWRPFRWPWKCWEALP